MNPVNVSFGSALALFGIVAALRPDWIGRLPGGRSRYWRDPNWVPALRLVGALFALVGLVIAHKGLTSQLR